MAEIIISSYFEDTAGPIIGLSPTIRIWEVSVAGEILIVGTPCGTGLSTDGVMTELGSCGSPASTQDGFYKYVFTDLLGYDSTKTYVVRVDGGISLLSQYRFQIERITPSENLSLQGIIDGVWNEPIASHTTAGSFGESINLTQVDVSDIVNTYLPNISTQITNVQSDVTTILSDLGTLQLDVTNITSTQLPAISNQITDVQNDVTSISDEVILIHADTVAIRTTDVPAILSLMELVRKFETNRTKIDVATNTLTVYDDNCTTVLRVFKLYDNFGVESVTSVCERKPQSSVGGIGSTSDGYPTCT